MGNGKNSSGMEIVGWILLIVSVALIAGLWWWTWSTGDKEIQQSLQAAGDAVAAGAALLAALATIIALKTVRDQRVGLEKELNSQKQWLLDDHEFQRLARYRDAYGEFITRALDQQARLVEYERAQQQHSAKGTDENTAAMRDARAEAEASYHRVAASYYAVSLLDASEERRKGADKIRTIGNSANVAMTGRGADLTKHRQDLYNNITSFHDFLRSDLAA